MGVDADFDQHDDEDNDEKESEDEVKSWWAQSVVVADWKVGRGLITRAGSWLKWSCKHPGYWYDGGNDDDDWKVIKNLGEG